MYIKTLEIGLFLRDGQIDPVKEVYEKVKEQGYDGTFEKFLSSVVEFGIAGHIARNVKSF